MILTSHELAGTDAADVGNICNAGPNSIKIEAIYLVPNLAVTANDTNYITLTVANDGTTVATANTTAASGAAHVEGTPQAMTITATGDSLLIEAGSVLSVDVAKAGTGPAYAFTVAVQATPVRES